MPKEDTQFKPGQSGNPGGRPSMSESEKTFKRLSKEQFAEVWNMIFGKTQEELEQILAGPDLPFYIQKSIQFAMTMSYSEWDKMQDRILGKVKEQIEHQLPEQTIIHLRDGSQIVMGSKHGDDQSS